MPDAQPYTLQDVVDPAPFLPHPGEIPWPWLAAAAVVASAAAVLLVRALRRRAAPPPTPRQRQEAARAAALKALGQIPPDQSVRELATDVSFLLRRFLADACADPALFETHEEFLARGEVPANLPDELRRDLAGTFATLARLKYAPDAPPPGADLVGPARALVERIYSALPA